MNAAEFDKLVVARLGYCHQILNAKANEYATSDRLHNFKVAAALQDIEPETALLGMWAKHIVSIRDIIEDIEHKGMIPKSALLSEKITDMINYALLLEGLIEERRADEEVAVPDGEFTEIELQTPQIPQGFTLGSAEGAPVIGHVEPFVGDLVVSESAQEDHPPKTETEPPQEAEPTNLEEPPEQEKKQDEVATIRESRNVPLDPETLAEVDRMLGDGIGVLDIAAELEKKGKLVPRTKIRARAAYIGRMKGKAQAKPEPKKADEPEPATEQPEEEPQEAEATGDRPEPVAISRKELDLRMWDLHQTGKTPDEISDILFSEGLYYKPKSVRTRLLSQGAKL